MQGSNDVGYQLISCNTSQVSVLANANDVHIRDSTFNIVTNVSTASKFPTLDVLYQRVAPNAILNEGGRADDAKCHPGTREEVMGLVERWMDAAGSNRIMWLTGPAGRGKTAIMKTIAERSANRGVQTVNFFFFSRRFHQKQRSARSSDSPLPALRALSILFRGSVGNDFCASVDIGRKHRAAMQAYVQTLTNYSAIVTYPSSSHSTR
ncbi:hypothetical protein D9619_012512 [Psilocybe cf. subviscida]|uniref:Nephrocystin 3-like N-terminal domain-containing protein n=1 Tax=Psilocybe cf. subviscida TaxID=2480587 RepID=A0A8H5EYV7_9AGAR|nr:hypothetical protein D9619_012512 [Psilocybe cf. subviscida]